MKILLAYASNSGNTLQAAEHIAATLAQHRLTVEIKDIVETTPVELGAYDLCILGSCTWLRDGIEGQLPNQFYTFAATLRREHHQFPGKHFAVFAFGRHEYTHFCGAADELEKLVHDVHGTLVTDTLRVDGFYQRNVAAIETWALGLAKTVRQQLRPA